VSGVRNAFFRSLPAVTHDERAPTAGRNLASNSFWMGRQLPTIAVDRGHIYELATIRPTSDCRSLAVYPLS